MNNLFLLFYSPKPRSHVRILIYRKWSIRTVFHACMSSYLLPNYSVTCKDLRHACAKTFFDSCAKCELARANLFLSRPLEQQSTVCNSQIL